MYIKLDSRLKHRSPDRQRIHTIATARLHPLKYNSQVPSPQATCCLVRTEQYRNWANNACDPWFTTLPPPLKNLFVRKQALKEKKKKNISSQKMKEQNHGEIWWTYIIKRTIKQEKKIQCERINMTLWHCPNTKKYTINNTMILCSMYLMTSLDNHW